MVGDKSLTGTATAGSKGLTLSDPNTDTVTVPSGAVWYVDKAVVDGSVSVNSSIIVDENNIQPKPVKLWSNSPAGDNFYSGKLSPDKSTFYAGANDNNLYAINTSDGSIKWISTVPTDAAVDIAVKPDGSAVYAACSNNNDTFSIDATDGSQNWKHSGSGASSAVAVNPDGSSVYVRYSGTTLYSLNTADGSVNWSNSKSYSYEDMVVSSDGTKIYTVSYDTGIEELYASNGNTNWSSKTNTSFTSVEISPDDATVYAGDTNGNIFSVNASDGSAKSQFVFGKYNVTDITTNGDGSVIYASAHQTVYKIDTTSGSVIWEYSPSGSVNGVGFNSNNSDVYLAHSTDVTGITPSKLNGSGRKISSVGTAEFGEYAYGGDTIAIGINLPNSGVGYRLGIREVVGQ